MANIKPFRAFIYNTDKIKDLSKVVCPPYDVISPEKQNFYHDLSPYNFIHILLGKEVKGQNKYLRAKVYLNDWIKNKIFTQDENQAIYFYSQDYNIRGEKKTRLGFIALLQLGTDNSPIFGHEHTRLEPKEDRFRLLRRVKANLSPIFVVFPDKKRIVQRTYQQCIDSKKPFMEITDGEKTIHKLWRLNSSELLGDIKLKMKDENIFIADGHHRYEVACRYRNLMKKKLGDKFSGEEDFNYVLTYFTNIDSRGLAILPTHRLLRVSEKFSFDSFKNSLKDYFDVEEVRERARFFFSMEKGGRTEHLIGMYKDKKYFLLRLKNIKILDKEISDKPKEYRSLDVPILNQIIFKKILGLDPQDFEKLSYSQDSEEFIKAVDSEQLNIAFFLNPVKIEQVISVALKGERMPPKSTYFYPKVLSGLVTNKLNQGK